MVCCLICGERIRNTTTDTLCPTCRPLYKVSRPTSRRVIPSDCIAKSDLRKLVKKWRRKRGKVYQEEDGTFSRIPLSGINCADDLEKLLKRGE